MSLKSILSQPIARQIAKRENRRASEGAEKQRAVLKGLLKKAHRTIFGAHHGLRPNMTEAEFREAVPVRDYEALKPWMDRAVAGEEDVLWPGKPLYFCKTSGTTSGAKYIPLTRESLPNHIGSARNALLAYIAETGKSDFLDGKMIFLQGTPQLTETDGGIQMGRLSGIVAHHVPKYLQSNRLPSFEVNCISSWESKIDAIVEETRNQDLRLISGIPSWVQNYFERLLEVTGAKTILEVFPNFQLFVFGGVAFDPYRAKFRELIGAHIPTIELFPASEGFFAYQDRTDAEGLRLNVDDGMYFEFIPVDTYFDDYPIRKSLSEVELGVQYALIVSSNAGLWGYDIGDTIKFVSKEPHRIVVTGRIKHFTSAFGEHVIAEEVEGAISDALQKAGGIVTEFHVAPQVNPKNGLPFHEWFIEFSRPPKDLLAFSESINESMMGRNPYYHDLIEGGILRSSIVTPVEEGGFHIAMESLGRLGGQNKPPRLSNSREFCQALLLQETSDT
jgi:hypothetical protein